jgi:(p)ppGpp synthase/HD superfamily hydrolase
MGKGEELATWVTKRHAGQLIKRSGEPYVNHVIAVGNMASAYLELGYEIGLCHDLLEDTDTTTNQLLQALGNFGYSANEANLIVSCVLELTDVFTAAAYPGLTKTERKSREAARLTKISATAQTVKYADLSYNINWVLHYDRKNARSYLVKKQQFITHLNLGDPSLRAELSNLIQEALLNHPE